MLAWNGKNFAAMIDFIYRVHPYLATLASQGHVEPEESGPLEQCAVILVVIRQESWFDGQRS